MKFVGLYESNLVVSAREHLLRQIIEILCYLPDVPQTAKTELLNRAAMAGINFNGREQPKEEK